MYQKANDLRNELFLNTLSWVDHLRPKFCLFENVEGFVSFNLCTTQAGPHRVTGGIEKGGIKFTVRVLTAMGYALSVSCRCTCSDAWVCEDIKCVWVYCRRRIMEHRSLECDSFFGRRYLGILYRNSLSQRMNSRLRGRMPFPFVWLAVLPLLTQAMDLPRCLQSLSKTPFRT